MCAFRLAEYMDIPVYPVSTFELLETHRNLLSGKNGEECEWSALTMLNSSNRQIIVHNDYHSPGRQQSNLMHELAHVICKHELKELDYDFPLPIGMRQYDPEQEQEAECLGSTMQLPKSALLWALKRDMTPEAIADRYTASVMMVNYRLRVSGANRQSYFAKAKRKGL